jgi:hypothetical protein
MSTPAPSFVPLSLTSTLARPTPPRNVPCTPTTSRKYALPTTGGGGGAAREAGIKLGEIIGRGGIPGNTQEERGEGGGGGGGGGGGLRSSGDLPSSSSSSELASLLLELTSLKKERDGLKFELSRGIGAEELRRLEKSFEAQEVLMAGYQREAESATKIIEGLKVS